MNSLNGAFRRGTASGAKARDAQPRPSPRATKKFENMNSNGIARIDPMSNRLLVADTQQQVAASRRLLRAGQRQR